MSYLGEVTVKAICQFLIVECAMLSNCRCVRSVRLQDLIPPVDVVLLYQLFFVLIKVFSVWNDLLKGLISVAGEEILLEVGSWSKRGPVM